MNCCNRKRTNKDLLFLPTATVCTVLLLGVLLSIEIGIAYSIGLI